MSRLSLIIFCLFSWLTTIAISAQETPKLVVGIVIEDLRADCLTQFWEDFSDGGFRQIFDNGASTFHLSIPYYSVDAAPDYVSAFTGATPSIHRIIANKWFDRHSGKITDFNVKQITLSTLSDELKRKNPKSKVIAIGHNNLQTIAMAGKKPDAAVWLDDVSSHWKISDTYGTMPDWALAENRRHPIGKPEVPVWQPLQGAAFSHSMKDYQGSPYYFEMLKTTPWANNEVSELTKKILAEEKLGTGNQPDMLLVGFSTKEFTENKGISPELKDIYLRLDGHIADLMQSIQDKEVLVVIVANQANHLQENILAETISEQRILSLLNLFLVAKYGQAKWVQSLTGNQIYLNHQEIEMHGYRVDAIRTAVADFLSSLSVVQAVYTSQQLENACGDTLFQQMQKAYNKVSSGDVIFAFAPDRVKVNEYDEPLQNTRKLYADVPFALFGNNIKAQKIESSATILDIAPTVSRVLNINKPNGNVGNEINFLPE
ncbi:MAG: alkaline phosphatase family protein [Prevotellaceae bacterium]|jgi:hypothetical protein|nr:alkaline phosphatase family protein [Prevotellaceae bacterium]